MSGHSHGGSECGHDHAWVGGASGPRPVAGISIHDLTVLRNGTPAVDGVSCELRGGALTAILGPNGAGKTTMLMGILGWLPVQRGTVTFAGHPLTAAGDRISYLPQRAAIDWDFPLTVRDVVEQGRTRSCGWWRGFSANDRAAVESAISEMSLADLQTRGIARLSGGQQQRVLIARALASGADILFLDEPLAGLDPAAAEDLLHALDTAARRGRIIAVVAHDLALVRAHIPHSILLNRKLIAAGPTADVLSEANLRAAFGERALGSVLHTLHAHG
ncbi:MAG: metal ABC transporter ATP-binding protein [Planctomycetota bacterium]